MLDHFGHVNFLEDQIIQITDNVGKGMARAEARNKCTFITWLLHGSSLFFSACYCWKADHNNATCSLGPFSWVSWHNFSCVASCSCLRFGILKFLISILYHCIVSFIFVSHFVCLSLFFSSSFFHSETFRAFRCQLPRWSPCRPHWRCPTWPWERTNMTKKENRMWRLWREKKTC